VGTELLPFDKVAALVATVSVLGIVLLLPLYLSQRRDVRRLRAWMGQEPGYAAADLVASESRLDRAELQLERAFVKRGEPVPGTTEFQAVHPDTQVTGERPALGQVTMERAALAPHQRWRRFSGGATQPRWLAAIALVALLLGVGGIVGVQQFLRDDESSGAVADDSSGIEVAVLNTTAASGIGGRVATQIEDSGFLRGTVGNLERETDQTLVMYQPDQKRSATRVAKELGGVATQEIDREVAEAAGDADVVVILGQDRVGP